MAEIPGDQIGPLMHQLVPMVATLNIEYVDVTPDRAVLVLRDTEQFRNHVGGPHAAAAFALGESATGAVVIAALGDLLDRAVFLPTTATVDYLAVATGDLTATAEIIGDVVVAREEFEAGRRPQFDVAAEITNAEGVTTSRLRATWTLKRIRTPE